jgi:plasmid replication initiation protein
MHRKNRGEEIGKRVRFSARELMMATNRNTDGREYKRVEKAFQRLQGTQFKTNIRTGNKKEVRIFSLIDEGGYVMREEGEWRLDYCEVVLSDWFMRAIEANEVISISEDYFRLRRPLERRIYEIARKHCGSQKRWHINLAKLQNKTGSNAPLKKFRLNIRQIIEGDHLPFYKLEMTPDDLVIFRPRQQRVTIEKDIVLPEWAEEKAREISRQKGWDYHALRANWMDFAHEATGKGNPPQNAGAAFVAYCNKQDVLR